MKYQEQENKIKNLIEHFLEARYYSNKDLIDEKILSNYLILQNWDYLDKSWINSYLVSNIRIIKKELEENSYKKLKVKKLCEIGKSLYFLNTQKNLLEKFNDTYIGMVQKWVDDYIVQLKSVENKNKINLSLENGVCCIINYILYYKKFFHSQLYKLTKILSESINIQLRNREIDFGMRYGIEGYIFTINNLLKNDIKDNELILTCQKIFSYFLDNSYFFEGLYQWPAIKKQDGREIVNVANTWEYGATHILFNLQEYINLQHIQDISFVNELKKQSYVLVGDLGIAKPDYYGGYAGILHVFQKCYKTYKYPCFKYMMNRLVDAILISDINNAVFVFHKFVIDNMGVEKQVDRDRDSAIIESYKIYIVLSDYLKLNVEKRDI